MRGGEGPASLDVAGTAFGRLGFDLIERNGSIGALTNCGGFPEAADELSTKGLLVSLNRAREVQRALLRCYPDEAHANCTLWAVYRAPAIDAGARG